MTGTPVPDPDAGQTGHCPRCGRALPRFSANAKMKVGLELAMPRDRQALIDSCLVDGPRTVHAVPITAEDVTRAARSIAEALQAAGWSDWAATLPDEAEGALDSTPI